MQDPGDPRIMVQVQHDILQKIAELIRPWSYAGDEPHFPKITLENAAAQSIWMRITSERGDLTITFLPRVRDVPPDVLAIAPGESHVLGE